MFGGLAGEGADYVVGFKTHCLENGNAQGFEGATDVGNLAAEVLGHCLAVGLVALVTYFVEALSLRVPLAEGAHGARALVAKDFAAHVEDCGKVVGRKVLAQLLDHVHEDVGGRRGQAASGGHGAAALHCVVGTEDERHGVEQEDGRFGLVCHGSEFSRGRETASSFQLSVFSFQFSVFSSQFSVLSILILRAGCGLVPFCAVLCFILLAGQLPLRGS